MIHRGELIVTKYRLIFVTKSPDPIQVWQKIFFLFIEFFCIFQSKILVDVPIGMISQIEKIGGQTRSNINDGAAYGIEINCKVKKFIVLG